MQRIEVIDALKQRIKMIQSMAPAMLISHEIKDSENGKYGVITATYQDSGLVGYDFIESDESWKRKNAVHEYNEAAKKGNRVMVIAPDSVIPLIKATLSKGGNPPIILRSYSETGITMLK